MSAIQEQHLSNLHRYFEEGDTQPQEGHWEISHEVTKPCDRNYIEASPIIDFLKRATVLIRSHEDSNADLSILSNDSRGAKDNRGVYVGMDVKIIWGVIEGRTDGAFHRIRSLVWKEVNVKVIRNTHGDPLGFAFNSQEGQQDKLIRKNGMEKAVEDAVMNPLIKYKRTSEESPYASVPRVSIPLG
ncbi:MAG: hypothetical protein AAB531_00420 [Patescibacteria group bacterium]